MRTTITKTVLTIATLLLIAAAPPNPNETPKKEVAEIGKEAPQLELVDLNGKTHRLSDYEGKIVVLEWFSESCPFCMNAWAGGLLPKLRKDLEDVKTDVVYLAINSTANKPEEKVISDSKEFFEEIDATVPMLMDYSGEVGHLYGAKTTPHMFVIDTKGVLVYEGALSDDKRFKKRAKAQTHVLRAVNQIIAGEEVTPSHVKPWGCSVKYGTAENGRKKRNNRVPRGPMT